MKIIKTATGSNLKISREEWESMGKKAGWMRISKGVLNIPPQLLSQLQSNMPTIMQGLANARGGKQKILDISFVNPYDNKQNVATIVCSKKRIPYLKGSVIDTENMQSWEIQIFVPTQETKQKDFTEADVLSTITHEFAHAIDPKQQMSQYNPSYNNMEGEERKQTYSQDPKEIDAFQTTFTQSVANDVASKKININDVLTWLKGSYDQPIAAPSLSYNDQRVYQYWFKNNPETIKLLKQRIYTALQNIQQNGGIT